MPATPAQVPGDAPRHPIIEGQIWREVDPRFNRFVRVEPAHNKHQVHVRTVIRDGTRWLPAPRTRVSVASPDRFNGKRGGYEYVEGP